MNVLFLHRRRYGVVALLTLLLGIAGCGTTKPEQAITQQAARSDNLRPTSVDALVADAMQRHFAQHDTEQALQVLKVALGKAQDRPDIAWLYSQLCALSPGCEPEPAEARLRKLDPGNGIAWLGALGRARARADVPAEYQILEAMSRSQNFNLYWNSLLWRLGIAISQSQSALTPNALMDPLTSGLNESVGWLSSIALPAFQPLREACSGAGTSGPSLRTDCTRISDAMRRSDTYIVEGLGLGIAQRLTQPSTPAAVQVEQQITVSRYQRETATNVIEAQVERQKFSQQMVELMKKLPREQDVFLTVLRWSGSSLRPSDKKSQ
ncbi:MAG TPA: hypothetical protein VGN07_13040 [Steroidobacteraceae bacterium]|jgi:hypothetical protein